MNENASGEAPRSTTSSDGRDARRAISRRQAIEGAVAIGVLAAFGGTVKAFAGRATRSILREGRIREHSGAAASAVAGAWAPARPK